MDKETRRLHVVAVAGLYDKGISAEGLAAFIGVARTTVWRWLAAAGEGSSLFTLPTVRTCRRIDGLLDAYAQIKKDATDLVLGWADNGHAAAAPTFYRKKTLRILRSGAGVEEKIDLLVAHVFSEWAKRGKNE